MPDPASFGLGAVVGFVLKSALDLLGKVLPIFLRERADRRAVHRAEEVQQLKDLEFQAHLMEDYARLQASGERERSMLSHAHFDAASIAKNLAAFEHHDPSAGKRIREKWTSDPAAAGDEIAALRARVLKRMRSI